MSRPDLMLLGFRDHRGAQGGVETHVRGLVRSLSLHRGDLKITALLRSGYDPEETLEINDEIKCVSIWAPRSTYFEAIVHTFLGTLYAAYKRPRILHIHAVGPAIFVPLARLLGLSVVFTHHGEDYRREKWGFIARVILRSGENLGMRWANEVIAIGKSLSADLSKKYNKKVNYIPNGVELSETNNATNILLNYGVTPKEYYLNVARFVPEKRQIDLIEAYRKTLPNKRKLVLVGASDHGSEYSAKVMEMASNTPGVICTGALSPVDLNQLYSNASLFILPSSHEGLPLVLLEAISNQLPVLVSDIDALTDLELPFECYFKLGDIDRISECMSLSHDEFPSTKLDHSSFLKKFSWDEISEQTLEVYRTIGLK